MLPECSKRRGGDWRPELEGLRGDPVRMLLAAVVLRAKTDRHGSDLARRFLRRVERHCEEGEEAAWAVVMAMFQGRDGVAGARGGEVPRGDGDRGTAA